MPRRWSLHPRVDHVRDIEVVRADTSKKVRFIDRFPMDDRRSGHAARLAARGRIDPRCGRSATVSGRTTIRPRQARPAVRPRRGPRRPTVPRPAMNDRTASGRFRIRSDRIHYHRSHARSFLDPDVRRRLPREDRGACGRRSRFSFDRIALFARSLARALVHLIACLSTWSALSAVAADVPASPATLTEAQKAQVPRRDQGRRTPRLPVRSDSPDGCRRTPGPQEAVPVRHDPSGSQSAASPSMRRCCGPCSSRPRLALEADPTRQRPNTQALADRARPVPLTGDGLSAPCARPR